jgi:hypothetical protein
VTRLAFAFAFVLVVSPVLAQSAYVAGDVGADVSRFSHTDVTSGFDGVSGSEVLSGGLRTGTSLGSNWGVELGFERSGRGKSSIPSGGVPAFATVAFTPVPPGVAPTSVSIPSFVDFRTDVRRSHSDLDTVLWARQRVSGSVDLVYIGGLAFSRERVDVTETFPTVIRGLAPSGSFRSTFIDYGTRPLVGAEARIGLTSHARLIPGLRLQGLGDGWLLRPYVGLGWFF